MAIHNNAYQHWDGQPRNIWYRRAVIARQSLRACLQGRWLKRVLVLCWSVALAQVAILFFLGQLLVTDSLIVRGLGNLDPQLRTIAQGLMAWLEMHPEVSVGATQNFLFYHFSRFYLPLTMVSLALAMPHLISRDLAGNAMVVYASKAVDRTDYLLGKFGATVGLLTLTWLGPVCVVWFLGNLLAPQWHFFWHSARALGHATAFIAIGMLILGALALGVSALSPREKLPVGAWIALWLVGGFISRGPARQGIQSPAQSWLENFSVTFNLEQIAAAIFRLPNDLKLAQDNIPYFATLTRNIPTHTMATLQQPDLFGAGVVLGLLLVAAAVLLYFRIRPE
jgi:ABC-2 type transport system permease protein